MSHKTSKAESSLLVLFVSFIETRLKMTLTCVIKRKAPSSRSELLAPPPTES